MSLGWNDPWLCRKENGDNEQQIQIGKKLRDARQAKGYTLDDLQQLTKIQKRYLIAIEDEKFDELPNMM